MQTQTRWYMLDTVEFSQSKDGYYCLCYEGDHLVQREFFRNRFDANDFGDHWKYQETVD